VATKKRVTEDEAGRPQGGKRHGGVLTVYKVRCPQTGRYQTAGSGEDGSACWTKTGKTWNTRGHLKAHFTMMREQAGCYARSQRKAYKDPVSPDWLIVELTVSTTLADTKTIADFLGE
jgi:hypothetical protein